MVKLKQKVILSMALLLLFVNSFAQKLQRQDLKRIQRKAANTTIIRDKWGIAHIYGKSDADAVFGMLYAQCEDDFNRVELNYIEKLGRLSEINGVTSLYNDLEIKLLIDKDAAKNEYNSAPEWLKKLLDSYADGINFYLYKHPKVKPQLLSHFEPWFPLLWTDGSIGAISTGGLTTTELKAFYGEANDKIAYVERELNVQTGSNGFAIAPSKSISGDAMLYINPHTTFYYRPEIHINSQEGLQAYGAVTWGQFFIYQGFNENCGWMHTSSSVDVADIYAENVVSKKNKLFYQYDSQLIPLIEKKITIKYLENGKLIPKTFKTYFTNHGPIMAKREGKWISLQSFNRSIKSLEQSWIRTKSKNFEDYKKAMDIKANTSNNTVYADKDGNIAYWHGNFIPVRDSKLNWSQVMDGTTSSTQWQGLHDVRETVHAYNPENGWLQNCNSTPFTVAGNYSPKAEKYPRYMAPDGENFRGLNAVRLLNNKDKVTLDQMIALGYDKKLTAFEFLIPVLASSFEKNYETTKDQYNDLAAPMELLKKWDYYAHENSVATALAVEWAYALDPIIQKAYVNEGEKDQIENTIDFIQKASPLQLFQPLQNVLRSLTEKFGTWEIPWGQINRFQRTSGAIALEYDDALSSLPISFGPAVWGSLPAFKSSFQKNTKKRYGTNGNSFVCAVQFGTRVKAKSLLAGGNNSNQVSKHFNDQAEMYQKGIFKEVLFYKEDVVQHGVKTYHPGEY